MSTRVARVIRGLLVAVVALTVAAVAHIATGGQIGAVGLVLAFAFSALASIALAGRTLSRTRMSIAVLLSQGAFHLLFGIGAGHGLAEPTHSVGMVMGDPAAAPASTGAMSTVAMADNGGMWAAHALAAIITIVALVRGERTFWKLAGWIAHSITRLFVSSIPLEVDQPTAPAVVAELHAAGTRFLLAGLRRRGPPVGTAST